MITSALRFLDWLLENDTQVLIGGGSPNSLPSLWVFIDHRILTLSRLGELYLLLPGGGRDRVISSRLGTHSRPVGGPQSTVLGWRGESYSYCDHLFLFCCCPVRNSNRIGPISLRRPLPRPNASFGLPPDISPVTGCHRCGRWKGK